MTAPRLPLPKRPLAVYWPAVIDLLILIIWGLMLVRFWVTGQLFLLLHPNYMWLSNSAAVILLGLGVMRAVQIYRAAKTPQPPAFNPVTGEHIALMPKQISSFLLLAVAVFGLIYTPQPFSSETALQRGITEVIGQTRSSPQRFVRNTAPEERTIIDWARTLNVYPEPDAYTDQPINVSGFVIRRDDWPENYFMISRFVLTCCAADAYPVGLPVQLAAGEPLPKADTWLQVSGTTQTDTLNNKRMLVIRPSQITEIPTPRNPYEY